MNDNSKKTVKVNDFVIDSLLANSPLIGSW